MPWKLAIKPLLKKLFFFFNVTFTNHQRLYLANGALAII